MGSFFAYLISIMHCCLYKLSKKEPKYFGRALVFFFCNSVSVLCFLSFDAFHVIGIVLQFSGF